jgi:CRISPR/Cas system-associated exonuclease Cas4 (RecB family)
MQAKIDKCITREDASKLVELELKSVANEQSNLKEDLVRIESKLDKILERDYRK